MGEEEKKAVGDAWEPDIIIDVGLGDPYSFGEDDVAGISSDGSREYLIKSGVIMSEAPCGFDFFLYAPGEERKRHLLKLLRKKGSRLPDIAVPAYLLPWRGGEIVVISDFSKAGKDRH